MGTFFLPPKDTLEAARGAAALSLVIYYDYRVTELLKNICCFDC